MLKFIVKNQINILFLILITYSQYYSPVISDDWFYHKNYNFFMADRPLASILIIKIHKFIKLNSGERCLGFLYLGNYDLSENSSVKRDSIDQKVNWIG